MMFKAEIVADSIMPMNHRITSMLITFPRYILAEFNTHRALSRNSASSRAIPTRRMVEMVRDTPFIPLKWMKDHKGMQGTEYLIDQRAIDLRRHSWLRARDFALQQAGEFYSEIRLDRKGRIGGEDTSELAPDGEPITKQITNRLLEPFMWHTVLVTATEWENFFALRDDPAADIHMQYIAHMMLEAMNASIPKKLKAGEWHMPFGDDVNELDILHIVQNEYDSYASEFRHAFFQEIQEAKLKIATARCARTSYLTLGESPVKHDYEKDIKLHDDLLQNGHMSPFEHCARAMNEEEYFYSNHSRYHDFDQPNTKNVIDERGWCGNFRGFIQYRKLFPNENRTDTRLIKHTY